MEVLERNAALDALATEPMSKRELAAAIDVSDATAQRILASFRESGLVEQRDDGNVLTNVGRAVGRAADDYRERVAAAMELEPLFSTIEPCDVRIDLRAFADATVTVAEPGDPYRPLNRFVSLLANADSLRGFDTTSVSPTYVEDLHGRITDGMPTEVIYEPPIVERLAADYPDLAADAVDSGNLTIHLHDDLPFGLALFDDHVGIGGYDDATGVLSVFVDSDDPSAIRWGEQLFERHREEATPLSGLDA